MAALGAAVQARPPKKSALSGCQHYVQFPGFEEVPTGVGAITTAPGTYGFAALFLVSGLPLDLPKRSLKSTRLELALWTEEISLPLALLLCEDPKKEPGNFGDPLSLGQYDIDMRREHTLMRLKACSERGTRS